MPNYVIKVETYKDLYALCTRFNLIMLKTFKKNKWSAQIQADYNIYFKAHNGEITQTIRTSVYEKESDCLIELKQSFSCYEIMANNEVLGTYVYNYNRCPICNMFGFKENGYKADREYPDKDDEDYYCHPALSGYPEIYYPRIKCSHCDYKYHTNRYFIYKKYFEYKRSENDHMKAIEEHEKYYDKIKKDIKKREEQREERRKKYELHNRGELLKKSYFPEHNIELKE